MVEIYLPAGGRKPWSRTVRRLPALLVFAPVLALATPSPAGGSDPSPCPGGPRLLVRGGTVLEGDDLRPGSKTIVVRGGRIEAVVLPEAAPPADSCTSVLDARGLFVVPGLWDLHVHVSKATPAFLEELPGLGITGVRDMGSSLAEIEELRRRVASGGSAVPHLSSPGPMFEAGGGDRADATGSTLEPRSHTRIALAEDDAELAAQLRSLATRGADFAKLRSARDGDQFRRFVRAAREAGLAVATHPPPGVPPSALPDGVVTIEHGSYPYPLVGGETPVAEVAAALRGAGIVIVPTLSAWKTQVMGVAELRRRIEEDLQSPAVLALVPPRLAVEWRLDLSERKERSAEAQEGWNGFYRQLVADLRALHQGGVVLAAGSDVGVEGVVPGRSLFRELCALETEIGVEPSQLLRRSTVLASRIAGRGEVTGSIVPGKSADLLLLAADPRSSTRAFASLVHVLLRGRPITVRDEVRELVASACPD